MMKYPILALDIDGTLALTGQAVDAIDKEAVLRYKESGGEVILASGRPVRSIKKYTDDDLKLSGWIVATGGAIVKNLYTDDVLLDLTLDRNTANSILDFFYGIPNTEKSMEANNQFYCAEEYDWVLKIKRDGYKISGIGILRDFTNDKVHKILAKSTDYSYDNLKRLIIEKFGDNVAITSSYKDLMEVTAPGVNKAAGIAPILDKLGFSWEQLAAIGDQRNDIEIIQNAALGAAMGNAIDEVKRSADLIVSPVGQGGVAEFINIILENSDG